MVSTLLYLCFACFISTHEFEIEFKQIEHLFINKLYDAICRDAFFLQYN